MQDRPSIRETSTSTMQKSARTDSNSHLDTFASAELASNSSGWWMQIRCLNRHTSSNSYGNSTKIRSSGWPVAVCSMKPVEASPSKVATGILLEGAVDCGEKLVSLLPVGTAP